MSGARECLRALTASAPFPAMVPTIVRRRPWVSALFVGERLRVAVTADDDDMLGVWLETLSDIDLPLRHGFVASVEVIERRTGQAVLEVLLIDD